MNVEHTRGTGGGPGLHSTHLWQQMYVHTLEVCHRAQPCGCGQWHAANKWCQCCSTRPACQTCMHFVWCCHVAHSIHCLHQHRTDWCAGTEMLAATDSCDLSASCVSSLLGAGGNSAGGIVAMCVCTLFVFCVNLASSVDHSRVEAVRLGRYAPSFALFNSAVSYWCAWPHCCWCGKASLCVYVHRGPIP